MLGGIPQILWGTNFENVLQFGYPLDSIVAGRKPRAGSEYVQSASGVEDAWIVGYDYEMTASFRWIPDVTTTNPPATAWSGSTGVQAFLDYARAKNTFRFVPDGTNPLFYVDGCYVSDPMDTHGSLESDGTRNLQLTIRNPSVDFHQALRGIMFEYAPGASLTDPVAATFTRATAATRRGLPGTLAAAVGASDASGVLRDRHYEGAVRTTLLEAARTQLVTDPENFGNWTLVNAPTRTAGQSDPFGGTAAYLLQDSDAINFAYVVENVTLTGGGVKAVAVFVKAGTAASSSVRVVDTSAGSASVIQHDITWTNGVPSLTMAVGTLLAAESWGGGWYRFLYASIATTAGHSHQMLLIPANPAVATGTAYFFGANAWDATFPSSYQGPSLGTRNADVFTWPQPYRPQAVFWLVDFIEGGTTLLADLARLLDQGAAGANSRWGVEKTTGQPRYEAFWLDAAGATKVSTLASGPAVGDRVQLLMTLDGTGVVQIHQALNLGTDVAATASGTGTLPAAWITALLGVNSLSDGTVPGSTKIISVKGGVLTSGGVTRNTIALALSA